MSHADPNENPYASPKPVGDLVPERTGGIRPVAILVGWLVDVGFTFAVSMVLGVVAAIILVSQRVPPDQFVNHMQEMHWINVVGILGGLCGTMSGGFVAAWMGGSRPIGHGVAVGVVSLITSAIPMAFFPDMQPLWVTVAAAIFTVPAAMLGGYLRGSRQQSSEEKQLRG